MSSDAAPTIGLPADTVPMRLYIGRKHAGNLSADAAGKLVGVSGQTWRNWESGQPIQHREAMLALVTRRLRLPVGYFDGAVPALQNPGQGPDGSPSYTGDTRRYLRPVAPEASPSAVTLGIDLDLAA